MGKYMKTKYNKMKIGGIAKFEPNRIVVGRNTRGNGKFRVNIRVKACVYGKYIMSLNSTAGMILSGD